MKEAKLEDTALRVTGLLAALSVHADGWVYFYDLWKSIGGSSAYTTLALYRLHTNGAVEKRDAPGPTLLGSGRKQYRLTPAYTDEASNLKRVQSLVALLTTRRWPRRSDRNQLRACIIWGLVSPGESADEDWSTITQLLVRLGLPESYGPYLAAEVAYMAGRVPGLCLDWDSPPTQMRLRLRLL